MSLRSKHALIIGSGEDVPPQHPPITKNTIIICADGGGKYALEWGLTPSIVLGDMDSIPSDIYEFWHGKGVPFLKYPVEKDKTDVELGIDYALEWGASHISLVGVWGGRVDHSLGNLELLYRLAEMGIKNTTFTSSAALTAFSGEFSAYARTNTTVSLIPLSEKVEGVTTSGLYYPLKNAVLQKGSTLGISNKTVNERIGIQCENGILLIVLAQ